MEIKLWKLKACIKRKFCFEDFTEPPFSVLVKTLTEEIKGIKLYGLSCIKFLVLYVMRMEIHERNISLRLNLKQKSLIALR